MEIYLTVISTVASVVGSLFVFMIKNLSQRLRDLEENRFSKSEVRQLIEDKIGGIHSDLRDIKTKVDKLFDLYIEQHRK